MTSKATPSSRTLSSADSPDASPVASAVTGPGDSVALPGRPDPQVPERTRRRTFTAKYKLEILARYDAASEGEKGALLRREGLYSSHIVQWRRARDAGALAALTQPRGRRRRDRNSEQVAALQADKARLEQELATARAVMDVQAKLHALLEIISESADTEPRSTR